MGSGGIHSQLVERDAENARLRSALADSRAELAATRADLAAARSELAAARTEIGLVRDQATTANTQLRELTTKVNELTDQVAKGNERIAELLVIAQRKKAKGNTKPDKPPEPPPAVGDGEQRAFDNRPSPPPPRGALHDRPRQPPRPTGRKPPPPHLPKDTSTAYPERCPCGCAEFDWVDEVVEDKLTVSEHQRVRRTIRKTGRCRACNQRTTAEAPPSPFPRSKVTGEYVAWLVVQRVKLLIPVNRLARYLGAQGVALSKSMIVSMNEAASEILAPIDGEHWRELLAGDAMATDGTGVKVQVPGVGLHHGFFEVYHSGDTVVFMYTPEKGGETQAEKLATFSGALLVDGESRYNETTRQNPGIVEYNCNAHPRRKLRDAEVAQPVLAAEAGQFMTAMFDAEADAKKLGLTGDALREWRQTKIRPITEEYHAWIYAVEPTLTPSDPLGKVLRYQEKHWTQLTGFIDNALVAIDNSGSERLFQPIAQYRLNSLFAGGSEGAHALAILFGIVATCTRLELDPEAYLAWVFVRRGTHRHKYNLSAADLTPAAYKRWLKEQPQGP
jgi:transposase